MKAASIAPPAGATTSEALNYLYTVYQLGVVIQPKLGKN